ncbi:hypothetical protein [Amycolatopsis anabasis]|uniref:hypothetical protein n=1 Tax=Amycolatopsis anabasis TaxID=1840409 RepID=UPI00131AA8F4|nr:hypothetical protein [Amycolatopsis anabasis]
MPSIAESTPIVVRAPMNDPWTDWWPPSPAAVSALLAMVAAIVAYRAYLVNRRTNVVQNEQLRQLTNDRHRDLAARFGIWIDRGDEIPQVKYHNTSSLPVYGVEVVVGFRGKRQHSISIGDLGPTSSPEVLEDANNLLSFMVEDKVNQASSGTDIAERTRLRKITYGESCVGASFRDGNGERWLRSTEGALIHGGRVDPSKRIYLPYRPAPEAAPNTWHPEGWLPDLDD